MKFFETVSSPLGLIELEADEKVLRGARFVKKKRFPDDPNTVLRRAADELDRYFTGELKNFSVPLKTEGTLFQEKVWRALRKVRWGEVTSYQKLARRTGVARAVRAVGSALGANPVVIFVPCHRVIQSHGSLSGYSGGIGRKRWLLRHENQSV